jgi:hypothetical protein
MVKMKPGPSGARLCVFSTGSLLAVQQPIAKAETPTASVPSAWRGGGVSDWKLSEKPIYAGLIYAGPYKARRKATADWLGNHDRPISQARGSALAICIAALKARSA